LVLLMYLLSLPHLWLSSYKIRKKGNDCGGSTGDPAGIPANLPGAQSLWWARGQRGLVRGFTV
jgi:hypothetical protein